MGYSGGTFDNPRYEDMKTGRTGPAEAVRIVFDPTKVSYSDLLEKWFFRMHDPTTVNRQGNDVGTQYRSAIFYLSDAQKRPPKRPRPRSTPPRSGPGRSSPRSPLPGPFSRPKVITRTISRKIRAATPVTSSATGSLQPNLHSRGDPSVQPCFPGSGPAICFAEWAPPLQF